MSPLPAASAALLLCALCSCSGLGGANNMPARDESASFFSGKVERKQLPALLFAEDSAVLAAGEPAKLREIRRFLADHPDTNLLLAGFAPEAGTEEYNRILGEQRAQVVRSSLLDLGVAPARLQTVSYGGLYAGSNDADSRRVEVGILRPPPP